MRLSRMDIIEEINTMCSRYREKIAITYKNQSIKYDEIEESSTKISQFLQQHLKAQSVVCVCTERNHWLPIIFLGILKAGMVYLPLSNSIPKERLEFIRRESESPMMIVDESYNISQNGSENIVKISEILASETSGDKLASLRERGDKAYIIFTSGSTGQPKGAIILKEGMENHLLSKIKLLSLTENDHIMQNASQCFDISIWQMLAPLIVGGTVHVIEDGDIFLINSFLHFIKKHKISILEVVPTYLQSLIKLMKKKPEKLSTLDSIRFMLVTGEEVKADIVNTWNSLKTKITLVNAYGPTEASDDITHYIIDPNQVYTNIPLGTEILNTRIYILDENGYEVNDGEVGELCVAGVCVGGGYINNPEITKKVFIDNPVDKDLDYLPMYRTGDLAHRGKDHLLYYHGRIDSQLKLNGYRIELGEIEQKAMMLSEIETAVTFCINGALWMVYSGVKEIENHRIMSELSEQLPEYMIPKNYVYCKELPLNQNGKIDRNEVKRLLDEKK